MKRLILATAVVIAALSLDFRPAHAYEGPWCAETNIGFGATHVDCHFRSLAECVPHVIAGNRGFCNMNPRWPGWYGAKVHKRHHRHRHRHRARR